jgi:hypothetical protein
MGMTSSAYGTKYKMYTQFWSENMKGIEWLEDRGVEGRIIKAFLPGYVSPDLAFVETTCKTIQGV